MRIFKTKWFARFARLIELDVYNKLAHIYLEDFIKAQQNGEVEEVHP